MRRDKLRADLQRAETAVRDGSLAVGDLDVGLAASEHVPSQGEAVAASDTGATTAVTGGIVFKWTCP